MDAQAGLCFCLSQTPEDSSLTPEDRFSGVEAQVCVCVCGGGGVQVKSLTYSFSHQLIYRGKRDSIPLPKMGHHQPTSKMPFKWCFTGGPIMARH